MTEQHETIPVTSVEEEPRGWAVPDPERPGVYVAVFACTDEDWNNCAENHDEAPYLETAEGLVQGRDHLAGGFIEGTKEEVLQAILLRNPTNTDKLLRNMLALLDAVVAGDVLYDPMLPDEQDARDALLADYAAVRKQVAAMFAHPLDTNQDVHRFLSLTEDWAV